jgi:hypothetical protein
MNDDQLKTIWQQRQFRDRTVALAGPMTILVERELARRVKQVGQIATVWDDILPAELAQHTSLESFNRGVLVVKVDSAPHKFQLQTMLGGGLLAELRKRCASAINRVRLDVGIIDDTDLG